MARRPRGPWLLAASLRAYQLVLWLYPAPFRRAWGADMAQLFGDLVAQAWRCRGLRGLLAVWVATLADLAASLPREHLARVTRPGHRRKWRRKAVFARALSSDRSLGRHAGRGRMDMQLKSTFRRLFARRHPAGQRTTTSEREVSMSFTKFTGRMRTVMQQAQQAAQRYHHNFMGTEHLLLGLVAEGEGVGCVVLRNLGVELDQVRQNVEFIIGHGDHLVLGEIGLTPRGKKVIALAVDEAKRMGHHYLGTEHLLLGLLGEGEGIAAGVLGQLGVRLEPAREETLRVLNDGERRKRDGDGSAGPSPDSPESPAT